MDGAEATEALDYVVKTKLDLFKVGDKTKSITDKGQRIAIVLRGNSREEMLEHIEEIKKKLQIRVKTDEGDIKGPIWD